MLIDSVVQREAVRNEQMILQYESLIGELPKGSITCRKNGYYYLRYREDGKLYDRYIGKDAEKVDAIREKLALRKHYVEMLSALKREQKAIHSLYQFKRNQSGGMMIWDRNNLPQLCPTSAPILLG